MSTTIDQAFIKQFEREVHFRIAYQEYERSRQIDAQQDTPNKIEDCSLIDVRD